MDNPLKIFALMWRPRRPSKLSDMPAVRNTFWLRKGYAALTFFGTIITATDEETEHMNAGDNAMKRHEMIHLRQAQSTGDSWLLFYVRYLWYYLRALPLNRRARHAAYRLNPFEIEAYAHMYDAGYLDRCREGANEWRRYAKIKPRERLERSKNHSLTTTIH